jgi:sugar/nucleoside kinase (ribokinase family)
MEAHMKFIAIGELMLRLSPPNYEKIVTTHNFIVNYGGAEANVAVSLANLGVDSTFFTVLPNTDLSLVLTTLRLMMYTLSTLSSLTGEWDFITLKKVFQ